MTRFLSVTLALLIAVLTMGALTACEDRPPIDVWGHKNSTSQRINVGVPF